MTNRSKRTSPVRLKITWLGHSAFILESGGGKRVLIDPWLDNPKAPPGAKDLLPINLILVTHGHSDHLGNTVELAKNSNAKVVSIFEVSQFLQSNGIAGAIGINKGGTTDVDGISVTMVDAAHSSDIGSDGKVVPGGEAAGFVVGFNGGHTVYHAGDTALFGDMKYIAELYKPDIVMLPIGGFYTMGPRDAAMACGILNPEYIIGMHYGTFPVLSGTPGELKKYLPARMKGRVKELIPGTPVEL